MSINAAAPKNEPFHLLMERPSSQYRNSSPNSAVFTRNGLTAVNWPVTGSVCTTTDCWGRNWYSNENLMLG